MEINTKPYVQGVLGNTPVLTAQITIKIYNLFDYICFDRITAMHDEYETHFEGFMRGIARPLVNWDILWNSYNKVEDSVTHSIYLYADGFNSEDELNDATEMVIQYILDARTEFRVSKGGVITNAAEHPAWND